MDILERRLKRREELFSILKQTILFDEFVTSLKDLLDNYPLSVEDLMFIKHYQDVLIYMSYSSKTILNNIKCISLLKNKQYDIID